MAFIISIILFDKIFMPTAVRHDDDRLVPSIVGFTVDSAGVILKEVDLGVAVVGEEFSTAYPVGVIISLRDFTNGSCSRRRRRNGAG